VLVVIWHQQELFQGVNAMHKLLTWTSMSPLGGAQAVLNVLVQHSIRKHFISPCPTRYGDVGFVEVMHHLSCSTIRHALN
jgi:hypothetical protein